MDTRKNIEEKVKKYYWENDLNCATTNLKILSETFDLELSDQIIDSALGMHGAGQYGAQCGLVEGTLMFIGILGRRGGIQDDHIVKSCKEFAQLFEKRYASLVCNILRPQGFSKDNPPHLCEDFTCQAVVFNIEFISGLGWSTQRNI